MKYTTWTVMLTVEHRGEEPMTFEAMRDFLNSGRGRIVVSHTGYLADRIAIMVEDPNGD